MVKKIFTSFSFGIIGIVLATAGVFMASNNSGESNNKVAAADTPYTTKWNATSLLTFCCVTGDADGNGVRKSSEIGLGVSKWTVSGQVGSTTFTESWSVPDVRAKLVSSNGSYSIIPTDGNSKFDANKWLIGFASSENWLENEGKYSPINYLEKPPGQINWRNHYTERTIGNGGITCLRGVDQDCAAATGAYGWLFWSIDRHAPLAAGLMMPLEWNVSGTLTE